MRRPDLTYRQWFVVSGLYLAETCLAQADLFPDVEPTEDPAAYRDRAKWMLNAKLFQADALGMLRAMPPDEITELHRTMTRAHADASKDGFRSSNRSKREKRAAELELFEPATEPRQ